MTKAIVERLRLLAREYWQHRPYYEEAADEIERLQKVCKDQAGVELSEENDRLIDKVERLRALLKLHDECWRLLHKREYTGALRDDTRTILREVP